MFTIFARAKQMKIIVFRAQRCRVNRALILYVSSVHVVHVDGDQA